MQVSKIKFCYKYADNVILMKKDININQEFKSYYNILYSTAKILLWIYFARACELLIY